MSIYQRKKRPYVRWIIIALIAGLLIFVAATDFRPAVMHVEKTIPYAAP